MIGTVNESLEAVVTVTIADQRGDLFEVDAVIDTGSTAWLTLPPEIVAELDLQLFDQEQATLADGQTITCKSYAGNVLWFGRLKTIQIVSLEMVPLIGMKLLEDCRLSIDVRSGGEVQINRSGENKALQ